MLNKFIKTSGGSVYDCKSGKQTKSFAFFYEVSGEKKRKVVSGNSIEELTAKAVAFLDKVDKECADAKEKESAVLNEIAKPARLTFRDVGLMWFNEYSLAMNRKRKGISYSSVESRDLALRTIFKHFGDKYMDQITQDDADNLIDLCSEKSDGSLYSYSYMDKLQQTFHLVIKYACKEGLYHQKLELSDLESFERADTNSKFLDREQVASILKIVHNNPRYRTLVKLLMATVLRQEEAFALTIDDFVPINDKMVELHINKSVVEINKNEYVIVTKLKSDRGRRVVIIPKDIYIMVMEYFNSIVDNETSYEQKLRQLNKTEKLIFADKEKKVPNKRTFERSFSNFIKRNGGKKLGYDVTLHMFRHSYASLMAETLPAEVVAKMLGDTIETVIKNYYSLSNVMKKRITEYSDSVLNSITSMVY